MRGTKLSLAIRVGQEAVCYDIHLVLEVTLLSMGTSILLKIHKNSKQASICIKQFLLLNLTTMEIRLPCNNFRIPFGVSTYNSHLAELGACKLHQCSQNSRIKSCRQGFSTATDETPLCLRSLYYKNDIPALRNCEVESECPSSFPPR